MLLDIHTSSCILIINISYKHEEISPIDTASAPCASNESGILIATGAPIPLNVATTAPVGSEPVIIVLARRVVIVVVVVCYMLKG